MSEIEWRPVVGMEDLYEVSNRGDVRSVDREIVYSDGTVRIHKGKELYQEIVSTGYKRVRMSLRQSTYRPLVQWVVLEAFVGPRPKGFHALHRNDNKLDNRIENLYWGTRSDNVRDRVINDKNSKGSDRPTSVLNEFKVRCVLGLFAAGASQRQIARLFKVDDHVIQRIRRGTAWKHVSRDLSGDPSCVAL